MNFFPNDDEIEETQSEPEAEGAVEEAPVEEQAETEEGAAEDEGGEDESSATHGARLILKRAGKETDIVFGFSPPATIGRFDPSVGPIDVDLGSVEEGSFVSRTHARIVDSLMPTNSAASRVE